MTRATRNSRKSKPRRLNYESLEGRTLLAAQPIITEFMASNQGTLNDGDRQSSDWIEIFNSGDESIDLQGWYLTDDRGDLTKWAFPSVELAAGGFLVVFASGQDTVDRRGNLHTNFALAKDGEYLGLVKPDGTTVATQFARQYPAQFTDVSYGFRTDVSEQVLAAAGTPSQVLVPSDGRWGTAWTQAAFVPDESWITQSASGEATTIGVGFSTVDSPIAADIQTDLAAAMKGTRASAYVRIPFQVNDPAALDNLTLRMKYDDGFAAYLNGRLLGVRNSPLAPQYDSTATADRSEDDVTEFEQIDIPLLPDLLVAGQNVLAIHGLNASAADSDFLILPELTATVTQVLVDTAGYFDMPTPGAANPATFSIGPTIRDVDHTPSVPAVDEPLVITAQINQTLHPVERVTLVYRLMYEAEATIPMTDDGLGADLRANDGVYTAVVPAGVAEPGQMLRFAVVATDSTDNSMRSPRIVDTSGTDRSPEYHGTVVEDPALSSQLPVFQWFTDDVAGSRGRTGARASVFYQGEFYDNVFVRQRGGFTNTGSQKFNFNESVQPFFVNDRIGRVAEINLNAQGSDPSFIRQSLAYESYRAAGSQASESFLTLMQRNGRFDRVGIFIEQVDESFLERHGLDPNGALYKFVQRSNLNPTFSDTTTGIEKKTRLHEDLSDLQAVVDGLNLPTAEQRMRFVLDNFNVPQLLNYLATRAVIGEIDDVRKNFYFYRDTEGSGLWHIFPWDEDWTFGSGGGESSNFGSPFFGAFERGYENPDQWSVLLTAIFDDPPTREMYLRRLRSVMDQLLQSRDTPEEQRWFENRVDELLAPAESLLPRAALNAIPALKRFFSDQREILYVTHSIDNVSDPDAVTTIIPEFVEGAMYFVPTDDSLGTLWTGLADPPNADQWVSAQTGIGFENSPASFQDLIKTTVKPVEACADCTSTYIRIPFQVDDVAAIKGATLQVKYDDGFVAYLNGTEIARRNVTGSPAYNVRARSRANGFAVEFENVNVSEFLGLLNQGTNVLAIHSVNSSATSSDMLMLPQLVSGVISDVESAGIPHAQAARPGVQFAAAGRPVGENRDEEFIELVNPLDTAVDISGWHLAGRVQHTFLPGTVIPAGEKLYVTPSLQAFRNRLAPPAGGMNLLVQGDYHGYLADAGEVVRLVASDGSQIDTLQGVFGDLDGNGQIDVADVDRMCQAIQHGEATFDITGDRVVNGDDLALLIQSVIGTDFGDANLDGTFDSGDLVRVFQAGEFEDTIVGNSTWSEGDWNCDGEFTTQDLVVAFQSGGFVAAASPNAGRGELASAVAAVPGDTARQSRQFNQLRRSSREESPRQNPDCLQRSPSPLRDAMIRDQLFSSLVPGQLSTEPDATEKDLGTGCPATAALDTLAAEDKLFWA